MAFNEEAHVSDSVYFLPHELLWDTLEGHDEGVAAHGYISELQPSGLASVVHLDVHLNAVHTNAVRTDAVRTNAVRTNDVRTNDVHTNAIRTNAVRTNDVRTTAVHTNAVRTNAVRTNAVHLNAVHTNAGHTNDVPSSDLEAARNDGHKQPEQRFKAARGEVVPASMHPEAGLRPCHPQLPPPPTSWRAQVLNVIETLVKVLKRCYTLDGFIAAIPERRGWSIIIRVPPEGLLNVQSSIAEAKTVLAYVVEASAGVELCAMTAREPDQKFKDMQRGFRAFLGIQDSVRCRPPEARCWNELARGRCRRRGCPWGHFEVRRRLYIAWRKLGDAEDWPVGPEDDESSAGE